MKKIYENISKNELYDLYIIQNKSLKELVIIFNMSISSINRALKKYNIHKSRTQAAQVSKKTCIEKYGVENPSQLAEVMEKKKITTLEHYGTEYYFTTDEFKKQAENTYIKKYGTKNYNNRKKAIITCKKKYGVDNPSQIENVKLKRINTTLKNYGVENPSQSEEIKQKKKQTCKKHYGVEHPANIPGIMETITKKGFETKRKNGTFQGKGKIYINNKEVNCSKLEEKIYNLLITKFNDVEYQYKSEEYPFACDFYIPLNKLYIEVQGYWGHGINNAVVYGPYNSKNEEHQKIISKWQNKKSKAYDDAIEVWTIRDPLKRETARKNNLNWIEFFNMEEFMLWFEKQ